MRVYSFVSGTKIGACGGLKMRVLWIWADWRNYRPPIHSPIFISRLNFGLEVYLLSVLEAFFFLSHFSFRFAFSFWTDLSPFCCYNNSHHAIQAWVEIFAYFKCGWSEFRHGLLCYFLSSLSCLMRNNELPISALWCCNVAVCSNWNFVSIFYSSFHNWFQWFLLMLIF